jgi:hypothetical protein
MLRSIPSLYIRYIKVTYGVGEILGEQVMFKAGGGAGDAPFSVSVA